MNRRQGHHQGDQGHEGIVLDSTLSLWTHGYAWLPDLRRRTGDKPVRTRLLGRPTTAVHGREAVRFFYDEQHVKRRSALPGPVLDTLFGHGAVHTLDGQAHGARKALFLSLFKDENAVAALVERALSEWDRAAGSWAERPRIELFTESSRVITRAVCAWAGIPLRDEPDGPDGPDGRDGPEAGDHADDEVRRLAADLVAMVDGFATAGPRHWRARHARAREEGWLGTLIENVREKEQACEGEAERGRSALESVALHRDEAGDLLDTHTAAVEVLNIIRPTVAVAWFVTFAAHALHRWPHLGEALRKGDPAYAEAFAHEVRRFYPFVPFVGGLAAEDLQWHGTTIPADSVVLLDIYGNNHDPELWSDPYAFDPSRFLGSTPASDELIPQGGDEAATGHRCPGEDITVALLQALATRLASMNYLVPQQDMTIPLRRMPTRPRSGFVLSVHRPG
ncbi:cytochrome P450 [Streptomyces sp. ISL-1]|uniref:cytochrome P450 n=1 Tax=Streptomyces sp. ISL-1 TaxID=2817657 RepID=UPI001BE9A2B7|nr:cytochrome P450 [Streptomyces sp. ISL-1]MBT2388828.1 cytochrome P450 [Streptomyces sp. ISL-1]